jgi:hypothetical protein
MPQICFMGQMALLPLQRKVCWGFFHLKNPTASVGFEPAILSTRGQHANHYTTKAAWLETVIRLTIWCYNWFTLHTSHILCYINNQSVMSQILLLFFSNSINRINCIYTCTLPAICKLTNIFIIFVTIITSETLKCLKSLSVLYVGAPTNITVGLLIVQRSYFALKGVQQTPNKV